MSALILSKFLRFQNAYRPFNRGFAPACIQMGRDTSLPTKRLADVIFPDFTTPRHKAISTPRNEQEAHHQVGLGETRAA